MSTVLLGTILTYDLLVLTYADELVALGIGDLFRREKIAEDRYDASSGGGAVNDARNSYGVPPRHEPGGGEDEKGHLEQQLGPNHRLEPRCRLGHEVVVVGFDMKLLFPRTGGSRGLGGARGRGQVGERGQT